jgi:hypothetical protein
MGSKSLVWYATKAYVYLLRLQGKPLVLVERLLLLVALAYVAKAVLSGDMSP